MSGGLAVLVWALGASVLHLRGQRRLALGKLMRSGFVARDDRRYRLSVRPDDLS